MMLTTSLTFMTLTGSSVFSCTILYAADDEVALGGNNEDYFEPNTRVWFVSTEGGQIGDRAFKSGHGRVYFGHVNWIPQGGMNDRGLFYDMVAVEEAVELMPAEGKPVLEGDVLDTFMSECATVGEVLEFFDRYSFPGKCSVGILIGDSTGDSAIIEPFDGFTFIRRKGKYQIATNFWQSKTKPENYTCERYQIAEEMLQNANSISVELLRRILAAVHQEGFSPTLYSNIYDLKRRIVYLYHFHNFENVVILDLDDELKKGTNSYDLPSLFPKTYAAEQYKKQKPGTVEGA